MIAVWVFRTALAPRQLLESLWDRSVTKVKMVKIRLKLEAISSAVLGPKLGPPLWDQFLTDLAQILGFLVFYVYKGVLKIRAQSVQWLRRYSNSLVWRQFSF